MPRRKRSTFGTIERRGKATWRIRWNEVEGAHARRRSETVHGTRSQAADRLAQIHAALVGQGHGRRLERPMTIRQIWETWYEPNEARLLEEGKMAPGTRKRHQISARKVLKRFGDVPARSIRPLDVQLWLTPPDDDTTSERMTRQPASYALSALRKMLAFAVTYEVVPDNVADRAYVMPTDETKRDSGSYTLAELARIARAARGTVVEAAFLLSMFGSCRTGESLGPTVDEVERYRSHGLTFAVVWINRQLLSDEVIQERLKTESSVRPVVIPPPWSRRLLALAMAARANGDTYLSDDGFGRPSSRYLLAKQWVEVVTAAGLPVHEPRAARRSWETYMAWDLDVGWRKVERLMGHKLPGVTGAHYDKPQVQHFVDAVADNFVQHLDKVSRALRPK